MTRQDRGGKRGGGVGRHLVSNDIIFCIFHSSSVLPFFFFFYYYFFYFFYFYFLYFFFFFPLLSLFFSFSSTSSFSSFSYSSTSSGILQPRLPNLHNAFVPPFCTLRRCCYRWFSFALRHCTKSNCVAPIAEPSPWARFFPVNCKKKKSEKKKKEKGKDKCPHAV